MLLGEIIQEYNPLSDLDHFFQNYLPLVIKYNNLEWFRLYPILLNRCNGDEMCRLNFFQFYNDLRETHIEIDNEKFPLFL